MAVSIVEKIDENQQSGKVQFAICPYCGQKLTDVRHIKGEVRLRTQCRRCRKYITIEIKEV